MNAYELADEITNCTTDPLHNDVANMLRQQANRIAGLEKLEQDFIRVIKQTNPNNPQTKPAPQGLIDPKSYYIGYEDGKKAPQTKPENVWTSCLACGQRVTGDSIHTCSPQTKPLSGVEIIGMSGQFDFNYDVGIIDFARAIEERHGIK